MTIILVGLASMYFLRQERPLVALGQGGSAVLFGVGLFLFQYGLVSALFSGMIFGLALLVFTISSYVQDKRRNRSLIIGVSFSVFVLGLPLIAFFIQSNQVFAIFALLSLVVSIIYSYDLSAIELTVRLQKIGKYSRTVLLPFGIIETRLRRRYAGTFFRPALFGGYVAFDLFLFLLLPWLVAIFTGGTYGFVVLNLLLIIMVIVAALQIDRTMKD
jgi:hypothetical protein